MSLPIAPNLTINASDDAGRSRGRKQTTTAWFLQLFVCRKT